MALLCSQVGNLDIFSGLKEDMKALNAKSNEIYKNLAKVMCEVRKTQPMRRLSKEMVQWQDLIS